MRPEKITDLPKNDLRGEQFASFRVNNIPASGALLSLVGNFLQVAEKSGCLITKQYGETQIYLRPTAEELREILKDKQHSWDQARRLYEAALVSGTEPEDYTRSVIAEWCKTEEIPVPWEMNK